jgi:nucleoside-diphosphate-sugar epimerase
LKRVLITGASGFVGRHLCARLAAGGWQVHASLRDPSLAPRLKNIEVHALTDIGPDTDWSAMVADVEAVVHLAARVHVMHETAMEGLQHHRLVNTEGTASLARAAAAAGVQRFIYLSTIKVNGERTDGQPFTETDTPAPVDAYSVSKLEAELLLARIASETGLNTVIFRPPLIYGPGVKGNFLRLIRLVELGMPLPLASIDNARSLLGVDNMGSAIEAALIRSQPVNGTFLISDDHDLSTPELVRCIGAAMGIKPRLLPCPPSWLRAASRLFGRGAEAGRMIESLRVNCSKLRRELQWNPPVTVNSGITAAVQWQRHMNHLPETHNLRHE